MNDILSTQSEHLSAPFQPQPITASRHYPDAPMVGTGVAIFNSAGEVLLVKSGKPKRKHPWGLPGGLLDLGEKLADGAVREVREECEIEIDLGDIVDVFEPIDWDEAGRVEYHFVVVDFWASYRSGTPTPGDDAVDIAWCAMDNLAAFNLMPFTIAAIHKARAAWQSAQESTPNTV